MTSYKIVRLIPKDTTEGLGYGWLVDGEVGDKYLTKVIDYYNEHREGKFKMKDLANYFSLFGIDNCSPTAPEENVTLLNGHLIYRY